MTRWLAHVVRAKLKLLVNLRALFSHPTSTRHTVLGQELTDTQLGPCCLLAHEPGVVGSSCSAG